MILQAIIKERYLFLSALDAIFPCTNDCSFESCRCLEAVLVLCLESCRTVSNLCRGLYKKLSCLKSPTGLKNGAIKLLLVSVPCENQQRFLRTNIAAILEQSYRYCLRASAVKKHNFLRFLFSADGKNTPSY